MNPSLHAQHVRFPRATGWRRSLQARDPGGPSYRSGDHSGGVQTPWDHFPRRCTSGTSNPFLLNKTFALPWSASYRRPSRNYTQSRVDASTRPFPPTSSSITRMHLGGHRTATLPPRKHPIYRKPFSHSDRGSFRSGNPNETKNLPETVLL